MSFCFYSQVSRGEEFCLLSFALLFLFTSVVSGTVKSCLVKLGFQQFFDPRLTSTGCISDS